MTILNGSHVTRAKPRRIALQRQVLRPLARPAERSARTEPKIPNRSPFSPGNARKTPARSRQPLPATVPQPRNISRTNLLSP
jgi:hypothetical protein